MAVEAQAVQITINVVDGNSGETVNCVTKNIESMGGAGAATGEKVAQGMDKIKGHSLTALDNVRLLRDDLGVRIPRSMEKAIASSKFLMAGIGAIGTGLLAVGAIDIGVRIGKGLYDAYEKWISLDAAAKAYQETIDKAKDEDFIKVRDIETATARINDATEAARGFQNVSQRMQGSLFRDVMGELASGGASAGFAAALEDTYGARQMADQGYKRRGQADQLKPERASFQHQSILDAIELSHAADGQLRGEQKITAEKQKQHAINEENRKFENAMSGIHGNIVPGNAGASRQKALDSIADRKADAETFNLRREQAHALEQLREQATEAGLRGIALYKAQESAAIDELKFKDENSIAFRDAVHAKFHAEEMRRLQDEARETEKIERNAAIAGMTGVPKIQAEGSSRVADITADETITPESRARRIAAANLETNQQVMAAEEEFTQRVNMLADESATHQISGFARIRSEATKQIDDLRREYEKLYGKNPSAPEYQAHVGELNRGVEVVNAGAGQQTSDLARKNAEETEQLESEARAKLLSAEKQQTAAIETEYEQRLAKFREQLDQQEISQEDYNRRVAAAAELRNAQMIDAARQAREKMAGEFSRFFKNPMESLKEFGDKAAGEAAAAMFQRVQGRFGPQAGRAGEHLGLPGGGFGGILDRIAGVSHPAPGQKPHDEAKAGAHVPDVASVKAISLGTADIHIQSANVAFGSATGASASSAGTAGASTFNRSGSTSVQNIPGADFGAAGGSTLSEASGSSGHGGGGIGAIASEAGSTTSAGSGFSQGLGDVQQGIGLVKQAKGIFSAGGSTQGSGGLGDSGMPDLAKIFGSDKTKVTGPSNAGMLGGGGIMANAGGAAGGAMGLFAAYQGNGGVGGALGGAMSGMELGMAVGGPIGAAVGLVGGAVLGAIGFGGREKARVYDLKTVRPRIGDDLMGFQNGSMDYTSAYGDMQALDLEARKTLDKMGGSARSYYWDTINKEIHQAEAKLTAEQKAGRSQMTASAAQFDRGGWTGDFGSMSTGADSGWAHMRRDEFVVNEQPAAEHAGALEAIRAGASQADMAKYYGGGGESRMPAQSGFGGDVHVHMHTIDAKSGAQWLMSNKHVLRSAINESYAENSGGADA